MHEAAAEIERLRGDAEVSRLRLDAAHAEIERLRQSDRSQPITPAEDTPDTNTTPGEGSVPGEGTVGERLVERFSITHTMRDDNEKLRAEIATLREAVRRLADQDATLSVCDGNVTVTVDATLTDEEREAIEDAAGICEEHAEEYDGKTSSPIADALRSLLERLHT
jgi:hypothetical protein